ncbi:MAG TPA: flagellar filament capping protein FliD, partial [Fimbriimonadaceae bacterium]|nr:flagellar filament capping protein FliD [Fimbriimonadaceae bacterium]
MSISGNLAGISFTGLATGIDSQKIIDQLMQIEAQPLQRMQQDQAILANKQSLFAQFKSLLTAFSSSVSTLNTAASFNPITASSSNTDVATVTAGSTATAGIYDLTVSQLAASHKVSSSAQSSATAELGLSGTFVVNGKAVNVESTDTLTSIAGKINSTGAGVTASVINGGSGNAYLTVTSKASGASNAVQMADLSGTTLSSLGFLTGAASFRDQTGTDTVRSYGFADASSTLSSFIGTSASGSFDIGTGTINIDFSIDSLQTIADKINAEPLANATASVVTETVNGKTTSKLQIVGSGGALPTITDTNGLLEDIGVYGRSYGNELVAAKDAQYTVDGFSLTSSSNTVTDVVPGATITLLKANATTPETATLTLSKDTDAI